MDENCIINRTGDIINSLEINNISTNRVLQKEKKIKIYKETNNKFILYILNHKYNNQTNVFDEDIISERILTIDSLQKIYFTVKDKIIIECINFDRNTLDSMDNTDSVNKKNTLLTNNNCNS